MLPTRVKVDASCVVNPVGVRQLLPTLGKAAQNDVAVECTCHRSELDIRRHILLRLNL
jgi:hypothetical protein